MWIDCAIHDVRGFCKGSLGTEAQQHAQTHAHTHAHTHTQNTCVVGEIAVEDMRHRRCSVEVVMFSKIDETKPH